MNRYIRKFSSGKIVFVLFVLTNLVYVVMLAITIPHVSAFADGMKLLDMMPGGYDREYVMKLFSALGEHGRQAYLHMQLPVDMLYPLLFGLCYCLLLVWLLRKIEKDHSIVFYAAYLPLIAAVGDYCENIGIITLLKRYPDITETSVTITSGFSTLKSSTTSVYFVVLLVVLLYFIWLWLKKQKHRK